MTEISATLVKTLRDRTGAGMMDCKKALIETSGDLEAAIDWLRKKGLSAAAKKAGRVAAEGLVALAASGKVGAVIELNAETDFVARNDQFQALARQAAQAALDKGEDMEALQAVLGPALTNLIATVGENMALRRVRRLSVTEGVVAAYCHAAISPGLGRIGVLVALESKADPARLNELGRQIAMHIAATKPESVSKDAIPADLIEREKQILADQARASGKPEDVIAKMVEGRLRKYYEEVALLEQVWVHDGERKVSVMLEQLGKEWGTPVVVTGFARFHLGEGVEKEQTDFVAEVAKMAAG
ncbi:MAG: elongation factor Ts [Alphaproteobacteria bacterium]|nr:MAG: elongation factor Ts [Alphaproteobacteria bacterium]